MFIDNLVIVAKRELAWEVDYIREAECTRKFKNLLEPYPEYYVPSVIGKIPQTYLSYFYYINYDFVFADDLSTKQIFTTDLIEGIPVDQCVNMDMETRKDIARKAMKLCVLELLEFKFMQTDPNWANFFYNKNTGQVCGYIRDKCSSTIRIYCIIVSSS